ncbi:hypothetical protein HK100_009337 [Physocladia obscura]|uniref:HMG box domain-containing protein n=1 Tax=Physocladia obscura TaxID=109957 RepID=A0AAD5X9R9_9FUNG|nr:hypothetical protein HK100_009337 [Physocladia obscura]
MKSLPKSVVDRRLKSIPYSSTNLKSGASSPTPATKSVENIAGKKPAALTIDKIRIAKNNAPSKIVAESSAPLPESETTHNNHPPEVTVNNLFLPEFGSSELSKSLEMEFSLGADQRKERQRILRNLRRKELRVERQNNGLIKPPNSFLLYKQARQADIIEKYKGDIDFTTISRLVGKLWRQETMETRMFYEQKAKDLRKEFLKK